MSEGAMMGGWGLLARRQKVAQRNRDKNVASATGVSVL